MLRSRPSRALLLLAGLAAATACLDESVTGTRAVSFSMSATPTTATVGEQVTFDVNGQGTAVVAIVVDFGDGVADTLTYPAAVEVIDHTFHSYEAAGSYTAVGKLIASNGTRTAEVAVTVN